MTANRLPNHVTPTKRYFRLCPLLAPSQASGTKVCTFGTLCKSLAKKFQIFLHFYSKDGKLFKRFVFYYRENLILVGDIVQKVQKSPDLLAGDRWMFGFIAVCSCSQSSPTQGTPLILCLEK